MTKNFSNLAEKLSEQLKGSKPTTRSSEQTQVTQGYVRTNSGHSWICARRLRTDPTRVRAIETEVSGCRPCFNLICTYFLVIY